MNNEEKIKVDIASSIDDQLLKLLDNLFAISHKNSTGVITEIDLFVAALDTIYPNRPYREEIALIQKTNSEIVLKINVKNREVVLITPELRMLILRAFSKKSSSELSAIDIIAASPTMPRIRNIIATCNEVAKCVDEIFKRNSADTETTLFIKKVDTSEKYYELFGQHSDQIIRNITIKGLTGLIVTGRSGVDTEAYVLNACNTMFTGFSEFRFGTAAVLDLSKLTAKNNSEPTIIDKLIGEVKLFDPLILVVKGVEMFGQDWRGAFELIDLVKTKTQATIIFTINNEYYKTQLDNKIELEKYHKLVVEEPNEESMLKIIDYVLEQLSESEKIEIETGLDTKIYKLSKRYLSAEAFPKKATNLISELIAEAKIKRVNIINEEILLTILSQKTNLPLEKLTQIEKDVLANLENKINEKVIGQSLATKLVSQAVIRARSGLKDPKKPIGSFLFLGPTGVGKTELAKTLGNIFFGDEKSVTRFDMSEFAESHTVMRLIGSPPGYVGYDEGGQLTNTVTQKPYSLILFDEIEKAHAKVYDIFLQILDEGRLTDSKGVLVDFKNTILVFTSNIGANEIFENYKEKWSAEEKENFYQSVLLPSLKSFFRMELINRFDEIIIFEPLNKESLKRILQLKLTGLNVRLKDKGISLQIDDTSATEFIDLFSDSKFGARSIERAIKEQVETPIAEMIIKNQVMANEVCVWTNSGLTIKK